MIGVVGDFVFLPQRKEAISESNGSCLLDTLGKLLELLTKGRLLKSLMRYRTYRTASMGSGMVGLQ